jgi:hypothetical protein
MPWRSSSHWGPPAVSQHLDMKLNKVAWVLDDGGKEGWYSAQSQVIAAAAAALRAASALTHSSRSGGDILPSSARSHSTIINHILWKTLSQYPSSWLQMKFQAVHHSLDWSSQNWLESPALSKKLALSVSQSELFQPNCSPVPSTTRCCESAFLTTRTEWGRHSICA